VASLVSAASAGGPPAILVPGGIGLGLVALAYGWSARGVIGLREGGSPAS
jgi:hypothetical protein